VPIKRAKELRHRSTELMSRCSEVIRRSELVVAQSKALREELKVRARPNRSKNQDGAKSLAGRTLGK